MENIVLSKIDNILKKSEKKLYHLPASENGMYFDKKEGMYELSHILSTNQAFVTGMALQAYGKTKDKKYIDWCMNFVEEYYEKVANRRYDTSQDLGMLYMLYAVPMYKITGDQRFREMALRAADELARRYIPNVGYIKAWGRADGHYPPYIDDYADDNPFFNENWGLMLIETMMNIPLLLWATRETNQPYYERIASQHVKATVKYLIRDDFSVSHGYRFNEDNGAAYCEDNYFGYAQGSYWAKGAAMAIYAFTLCSQYARYAPKADFGIAQKMLERFIEACNGELPVWDFDSPDKRHDTQAAAITLCALRKIRKIADSPKIKNFEEMLEAHLIKNIDKNPEVDGILKGQNGKDEYSIVGDYFALEALFFDAADIWNLF